MIIELTLPLIKIKIYLKDKHMGQSRTIVFDYISCSNSILQPPLSFSLFYSSLTSPPPPSKKKKKNPESKIQCRNC